MRGNAGKQAAADRSPEPFEDEIAIARPSNDSMTSAV
jgi:hypothetical protein